MTVTNGHGKPLHPTRMNAAIAAVRAQIDGLAPRFNFQDLRHYFASMLIASGLDIKTVQARMRHAHASTTMDVYGRPMPDADESSRAALASVFRERHSAVSGG